MIKKTTASSPVMLERELSRDLSREIMIFPRGDYWSDNIEYDVIQIIPRARKLTTFKIREERASWEITYEADPANKEDKED